MSNCIWINQYVRQDGVTVRSHQRCYSKPLSKADKDLYDRVSGDAERRWDDYIDAEREADAYTDLLRDAEARNSPLLADIKKNRKRAFKKVFKSLDQVKTASKKKATVEKGLGISDDPGAMELIDPQGRKLPSPKRSTPHKTSPLRSRR